MLNLKKKIQKFFTLGIFLIMSLYHFGLFVQRREDKPSLFFGILAFIFAVRQTLTSRLIHEFFIEPDANLWEWFYRIEFMTPPLACYFGVSFIQSIAPQKWYESFRKGVI